MKSICLLSLSITILTFGCMRNDTINPDAVLKNSMGQELLYLVNNQVKNSSSQVLGHFDGDNLLNSQNQKIAYIKNEKIFNSSDQQLGQVLNSELLNVNGQSIMTVEGPSIDSHAKLGAAFFFFLQ